jgi:lycopene beta-cyclase
VESHPGACDAQKNAVIMIGAGLASTSLALSLLARGFSDPIILLERNAEISVNKTWCFWGFDSIPDYLKPLVAKRWSNWQVSDGLRFYGHHSDDSNTDYCCIRAEDFYQFALERFAKTSNVKLMFEQDCKIISNKHQQVSVQHNGEMMYGRYGFDSSFTLPNALRDGLYQSFTGAWIKLDMPHFDPEQAGLMLDLKVDGNAIQFSYILPISETEALWEETRFSPSVEDLSLLKARTELLLAERFKTKAYTIHRWEQGVLPMSASLYGANKGLSDRAWHKIGTAGGMMRAASGYAFSSIQRWSKAASLAIVTQQTDMPNPVPRTFEFLDAVFLRVLRAEPELAPMIFTRMMKGTSAAEFARFMTENAELKDIVKVIKAMPKWPFLKALL